MQEGKELVAGAPKPQHLFTTPLNILVLEIFAAKCQDHSPIPRDLGYHQGEMIWLPKAAAGSWLHAQFGLPARSIEVKDMFESHPQN